MIEKAVEIAMKAHEGQTRKYSGKPYVSHPFAVSERVETLDQKVVAILHDVPEDTNKTLDDLREHFPEHIVEAIDHLTRREGESYKDFVLRAKENDIARVVKIADIQHNLSDLPEGHGLRKRYEKALKELSYV